jgi:chromosome segregation ATPase
MGKDETTVQELTGAERLDRTRSEIERVHAQIADVSRRMADVEQQQRRSATARETASRYAAEAEQKHRSAMMAVSKAAANVRILKDSHGEAAAQLELDRASEAAETAHRVMLGAADWAKDKAREAAAEDAAHKATLATLTAEAAEARHILDALTAAEKEAVAPAARERFAELPAEIEQTTAQLEAAKARQLEVCRELEQLPAQFAGSNIQSSNDYRMALKAAMTVMYPPQPSSGPLWLQGIHTAGRD